MELKDLVKYYVPMRMEGSSPPNWEVVFFAMTFRNSRATMWTRS